MAFEQAARNFTAHDNLYARGMFNFISRLCVFSMTPAKIAVGRDESLLELDAIAAALRAVWGAKGTFRLPYPPSKSIMYRGQWREVAREFLRQKKIAQETLALRYPEGS